MKAHRIVSLLLKCRGVTSDSFCGKMRLYCRTLKMKVKVGNFQVLEMVTYPEFILYEKFFEIVLRL